MSRPVPVFRTANWSSYNQALKRRGSLMIWFDPEMAWFAVPNGKAGHPERFSSAAIQFCLSIKVLFVLPLRQVLWNACQQLCLSAVLRLPRDACFEDGVCDCEQPAGDSGDDKLVVGQFELSFLRGL